MVIHALARCPEYRVRVDCAAQAHRGFGGAGRCNVGAGGFVLAVSKANGVPGAGGRQRLLAQRGCRQGGRDRAEHPHRRRRNALRLAPGGRLVRAAARRSLLSRQRFVAPCASRAAEPAAERRLGLRRDSLPGLPGEQRRAERSGASQRRKGGLELGHR